MDVSIFWEIIGLYNNQTIFIQFFLFALIVISFILSYSGKCNWLVKLVLGIINVYIGIVFFGYFGTEKIQKYFALPLYIICGILLIYESIKNKNDTIEKLNIIKILLLIMCILYPLISFLLGNRFPKITTYIMPCPIMSYSIIIYSGYRYKNKLLLIIMAIWGLTGIKAFVANAYEDIILLICGLYCIYILGKQYRMKNV
jgi:hypothetical protein